MSRFTDYSKLFNKSKIKWLKVFSKNLNIARMKVKSRKISVKVNN
jgi:hypothetical protein